jgi:hypothetical protein
MEREGPSLESLTHRLAEIPQEFLDEPRIANAGQIDVGAVVNDLLLLLGRRVTPELLADFHSRDAKKDRNRLGITLVLCWLLADDWFRENEPEQGSVLELLRETASELAGQAVALKYVQDPDRREELSRLALARIGCRPAGETLAQAQDRLSSLSSTERSRVLKAARAAEERARAVREALARKAAEESADKYTRE